MMSDGHVLLMVPSGKYNPVNVNFQSDVMAMKITVLLMKDVMFTERQRAGEQSLC